MAVNPYTSYSRFQLENQTPAEQVAALFAKAAYHMEQASEAIKKNDIVARYESSQKAITILEGLLSSLKRDTAESEKIAADLEAFYLSMISLIGRMNVYNNLDTCLSLVECFKDMANVWESAGKAYEEELKLQEQSFSGRDPVFNPA